MPVWGAGIVALPAHAYTSQGGGETRYLQYKYKDGPLNHVSLIHQREGSGKWKGVGWTLLEIDSAGYQWQLSYVDDSVLKFEESQVFGKAYPDPMTWDTHEYPDYTDILTTTVP